MNILKPSTFKISGRVSIPVNKEVIQNKDFIPKDIGFEDNKIPMEQVGIAMNNNLPVLLVGETGTGKTSLVRHLACRTNNAFVRVNHNGGTSVEDIVGRWLINEKGTHWVDGILIDAMKKGHWYLADEINAASAEINFVYHSLLDDDGRVVLVEKDHEVIIPHKNFRFFGAMNPPTEYAGTKELNKALLSRFAVVKIDFVPPKVEAKILVERTGIDQAVADKMVAFASQIRMAHVKQKVRFVISTRELLMWAQMYKVYGKFINAAESSIMNKVNEEDIAAITDTLGLHFKNMDGMAKGATATPTPNPSKAGSVPSQSLSKDDLNSLVNITRIMSGNSPGYTNNWPSTSGIWTATILSSGELQVHLNGVEIDIEPTLLVNYKNSVFMQQQQYQNAAYNAGVQMAQATKIINRYTGSSGSNNP